MNITAEQIKSALSRDLPGTDVQWEMASSDRMTRDFPRSKRDDSKLGAVLIIIYPWLKSHFTLFIQRPDYNGVHSGQIGFPGGKMEEADKTLVDTAIREACEETGICREEIEVLGTLTPLYIPVSDIEVTPVVAWSERRPELRLQSEEVLYVIESDLQRFNDPSILQEMKMEVRGEELEVLYFNYDGHVIWGATAMMLHELMVLAERANITFQE